LPVFRPPDPAAVAQPLPCHAPSTDGAMNARSKFRKTDRRVANRRAGRIQMYLINRLRELVRDDSGQDLIEYALLAALIALASVIAIQAAGTQVNNVWNAIVGMLQAIPVG
jgi:pilus assembly protein Flp/PilA